MTDPVVGTPGRWVFRSLPTIGKRFTRSTRSTGRFRVAHRLRMASESLFVSRALDSQDQRQAPECAGPATRGVPAPVTRRTRTQPVSPPATCLLRCDRSGRSSLWTEGVSVVDSPVAHAVPAASPHPAGPEAKPPRRPSASHAPFPQTCDASRFMACVCSSRQSHMNGNAP